MLDPRTLDWVARAVGKGARVVGGRRLTGGITSSIHRLTVETRTGVRQQVVLRRWTPGARDDTADASLFVARERHVLGRLEATDVPAPRFLAADPMGESTGVPALLMSRVAGRMDLAPRDPKTWLQQIVAMAVRIHELDVDAPPYRWEARAVPVPAWASKPADWRAAAELVRGPAPDHDIRFSHGDYQHFNFLWQRGRLTGVVDWVFACRGPSDVDVGHCGSISQSSTRPSWPPTFWRPTRLKRAGAWIRTGTSGARPRPLSKTGPSSSRSRLMAARRSIGPV